MIRFRNLWSYISVFEQETFVDDDDDVLFDKMQTEKKNF